MRQLTLEEQMKFLDVLRQQLHSACIISADEICYGSLASSDKADKEYRYLCKVLDAIPKDVIAAYNGDIRKRRAEELRKKANAIERGEDEAS